MKKSMILGASLLAVMAAGAQKYNMVVETTDGQKTVIPVDNIESMAMTPQPNYIESDHLTYALYTTRIDAPDMATYRLDFANAPANEYGLPISVGDMVISIEFTAAPSASNYNAILPSGNYKAGNNTANFTFNCQRSDIAIRVAEGNDDDAISYEVIAGGYIDVGYVDGEYDIRAELLTLSGAKINASFCGPVNFQSNPINAETFDEDLNIAFEGVQGRFYANWTFPFADDMNLELYTGTFDINDNQTEGYWLSIPIYMPKAANPTPAALPSPKVADGVYNVELRTSPANFFYCYQPFTFMPGKIEDIMGTSYDVGTLITHIDRDGKKKIAHINGGTLTVSENGTKFDIDFTTTEGIKVTGSYSGSTNIANKCDNFNKQPERPFSTLTEDYQMTFNANAAALAYDEGDNYLCPGKKSMYFTIKDPNEKGDYISFDLTADENGLVDGTYTVNDTFEPFCALFGRYNYSDQPIFSWFGNLDEKDDDDCNIYMAPITGGTFTIATDNNGVSTVTFNLLDDKNNAITGTWTGTIIRDSSSATTLSLKHRK